jgi:pre-rRNA-processing protein TSR1
MSKIERRNQAKQKRLTSYAQHVKATSVFSGKDGAPRIIAVVPLCEDISAQEAVRSLNKGLECEEEVPAAGWFRCHAERFKQNLQYLVLKRDLLAALDACRVADYVLFVLSATEEVDSLGGMMLRCIESQGLSNCLVAVQGLDKIEPVKRRLQVTATLKNYITHFLPAVDKVNSLDSTQESLNIVRSLCTTTPKSIHWREDRSWVMVEEVRWPGEKSTSEGTAEVVLTGVVRGKGLKADRLLQVGDWGAFQVEKIVAAPVETRKKAKEGCMAIDIEGHGAPLDAPTEDQDDLAELAPQEVAMDDMSDLVSTAPSERKGVLVDDHHYFSDEDTREPEHLPKRLPRGTSKYQAAWFIDDASDSGSDMEEIDENMWGENGEEELHPADGDFDMAMRDLTEAGPSEYPQSEMFLDPSPEDEAEAIDAYRQSRKDEAVEDLEFPDEIELPPNVLARERLAKYRGLKSLKTSVWETEEDRIHEPQEWRRLLEVNNYKGAKNRVLGEALVGGVKAGARCSIHLRAVPLSFQHQYDTARPLSAFSLLRHEHKRIAMNCSMTLSSEAEAPIRSKEEIIMQCGPRRFAIHPLFSQPGNTPNNVHKFNRFLHPGRTAIASFIAPLTWGSVPTLYFKNDDTSPSGLKFIGTGTALPPSQSRVIAKRIILTGHPYKIHKRVVTVRYMFFNTEDVAWFKALQLWTKRGRSGFIKESLGTHGYFKATFDGRINPMDAVAVSLYKRVWPRWATPWRPDENLSRRQQQNEAEEVPELVMGGQ